jgi:hypothetical protein
VKEKFRFINVCREKLDGFVFLGESIKIDGFCYLISVENYEEAKKVFGNPEDSDILVLESPEFWLSQFFDKETFEEFDSFVVDYYGGPQNAVNVLEVGSSVEEEELNEVVVSKVREKPGMKQSNVSVDVEDLLSGGIESGEIVLEEFEPVDESEILEILNYLKSVGGREMCSAFVSCVCSFADDEEVSDKVLDRIYRGIVNVFENLIDEGDERENAVVFLSKIVDKFLSETE